MSDEPFNCQVEGKPCDRWCGANSCLAERESEHAAELTQTTTPTNEVPSGPASAAPEPKEAYCIDYAQGRARGLREGDVSEFEELATKDDLRAFVRGVVGAITLTILFWANIILWIMDWMLP